MNFPSVSQFSIAKGTGGTNPPEMYIPLWWYSGSSTTSNNATGTASGSYLVVKGSTNSNGTSVTTGAKLHTLNSSWASSIQYAFEASLSTARTADTVYAALWDITSNAIVSTSQISLTGNGGSFNATTRSTKFTLTPGHSYGITLWSSNDSGNVPYITDASLIVFPS